MFSYYPQVIKNIEEFQTLIDCEYPEFDQLSLVRDEVLDANKAVIAQKRGTWHDMGWTS